jgi:hypothetical protein
MLSKILLKTGWSKEDIRDAKILTYIAGGFIIFASLFIIPWVYGWYKILV